jgi:hypothetical protein
MKNIIIILLLASVCTSCYNPFDAEQTTKYFLTKSRWREVGSIDPYLTNDNYNVVPLQDTTNGYKLWKRYLNDGTGIITLQLHDTNSNIRYDTTYFKWILQQNSHSNPQITSWFIQEKIYSDKLYQILLGTSVNRTIITLTNSELVVSIPGRHGAIRIYYTAE